MKTNNISIEKNSSAALTFPISASFQQKLYLEYTRQQSLTKKSTVQSFQLFLTNFNRMNSHHLQKQINLPNGFGSQLIQFNPTRERQIQNFFVFFVFRSFQIRQNFSLRIRLTRERHLKISSIGLRRLFLGGTKQTFYKDQNFKIFNQYYQHLAHVFCIAKKTKKKLFFAKKVNTVFRCSRQNFKVSIF